MVDVLKLAAEIYLRQNGIDAVVITGPIDEAEYQQKKQSKEETA